MQFPGAVPQLAIVALLGVLGVVSAHRPASAQEALFAPTAGAGAAQGATTALPDALSPAPPAYGRFLAPTLGLRETWTSDVAFGTGQPPVHGWVTDLTAALALAINAPSLSAKGRFQVDGYEYIPARVPDHAIPLGDLTATWEAVAGHLFLDGGVFSTRVIDTPYGVASAIGAAGSTSSLTQVRAGPRLQGEMGGEVHYTVRSMNGWSSSVSNPTSGVSQAASFVRQDSVEIERRPLPIGVAVSVGEDLAHYGGPVDATVRDTIARVVLRARPTPEFLLGIHGGEEHLNYTINGNDRGRVLGADLAWRPSERTSLTGFGESRIAGLAWEASLHNRSAFTSIDIDGYRHTTTAPQSLLGLSGVADLQRMVEAIYTARYPDPTERARAVDAFLEQTGAPAPTTLNIYSADIAMQSREHASFAYIGPRDVISVSAAQLRHEPLPIGGAPLGLLAASSGPYRDTNVALTWTHRLRPLTALSVKAVNDQVSGQGAEAGSHTHTRLGAFELSQQLSPRLDALLGLLRQTVESTVLPQASQNAVYAGATYRF
jgi:uncharacterized protein (PEP-CTERM system associated)